MAERAVAERGVAERAATGSRVGARVGESRLRQERSGPEPERRSSSGFGVSIAALTATLIAASSLKSLVQGDQWWFVALVIGLVAVSLAALVRRYPRVSWLAPFVALVTAGYLAALTYAGDTFVAFLIPTPESVSRMSDLLSAAGAHIQTQAIPASPNRGLEFLLVIGLLAAIVFIDALAVTVRAPLLAGIPLLALVALPSRVLTQSSDLAGIAVTTGAVLLLVWLDSIRETRMKGFVAAAAVTVVAIIGGFIGQAVAPAFDDKVVSASSLQPIFTTGADPLVRLGDHLRRGPDVPVMTYRTDSQEPVYLRVVTIEDLSGEEWRTAPLEDVEPGQRQLDAFPAPEGLADDVARTVATTEVTDLSPSRRWLPTPYPAVSVTGLPDESAWAWQPETLAVGTRTDAQASSEYTVTSLVVQPTADQLRAADGRGGTSAAVSLDLPADMPAVIRQTTDEVVAGQTTQYDRAMAIQNYLRGSEFRYDEDTPEQADGDGDSFDVIAKFLSEKRGYCVHYASAMAVMARTLDIPARIAVGYQPGDRVPNSGGEYEVTSHDLHAWPELYFEGVGWTRFEPTPGRGDVPDYNAPTPDDTSAPTPSTAPEPTPSQSAAATPREEAQAAAAASNGGAPPAFGGVLLVLAALAVLSIPAVLRRMRRRRRLTGSDASSVWEELHDTAADLGMAARDLSPRALQARLAETIRPGLGGGRNASLLEEVRGAAERARYSRSGAESLTPAQVTAVESEIVRIEQYSPWRARLVATVAPRSLIPRGTWPTRTAPR